VRRGHVREQGLGVGRLGEIPGYIGDPTKASAAKGERLVAAWAAGFADFLGELHQAGSR
jgi:creatinine amidohydrolase/Fe(II)-dependent formamide hydrolase-like protein